MSQLYYLSHHRCTGEHSHTDTCFYRIEWALNPQTRVGAASPERAAAEHGELRETMINFGAKVEVLPFVTGAYDSVFIKDNGILFERGGNPFCVLGRARHSERARENEARQGEFEKAGFTVLRPPDSFFEGGDFIYLPHLKTGLLGYGFRTEQASARALSENLGVEVVALELRDPWIYHLDLALNMLSDGTCFACPNAFSADSWKTLERLFPGDALVSVSREEALRFSLNWVEIGKVVLHGAGGAEIPGLLRRRGFETRAIPLTQFEAAGGSAACLVNRVWKIA